MWTAFITEISALENILRLVMHFGAARRNYDKFHGFGAARRKNRELHQIGTIGAAIAPLTDQNVKVLKDDRLHQKVTRNVIDYL